jgi:hypothetical protein
MPQQARGMGVDAVWTACKTLEPLLVLPLQRHFYIDPTFGVFYAAVGVSVYPWA